MIKRGIFAFVLPSLALIPFVFFTAYAQTNNTLKFISQFDGNCMMNLGYPERIKAAARAFKWQPLSQDILITQNADAGWIISDEGAVFILAISERQFKGTAYSFCSVSARNLRRASFDKYIRDGYRVIQTFNEKVGLQKYTMYEVDVGETHNAVVMVTTHTLPSVTEATIAAGIPIK